MPPFEWINKQDGIDDVFAEDINSIANETLRLNIDKANKSITISGYGIEDAYTKKETNEQIAAAISSGVTPELIKKAEKDLSNVSNEDFKNKAIDAGVDGGSGGAVFSVNEKTGDVVLTASDVGAITEEEVESLINASHSAVVFPRFRAIEAEVATKATNDLSNVSNEAFLAKLNAVLPDGDEVSY